MAGSFYQPTVVPLNPRISTFSSKIPNPLLKFAPRIHPFHEVSPIRLYYAHDLSSSLRNGNRAASYRCMAGRSKGNSGGPGRMEGMEELRREVKRSIKKKARKYEESFFYRLKNPHKNFPDNFSEDELQMIGLGYDRLVRFMDMDDPNLKHPYDWYKYGEFGPYSWRGVVLGDPIRGGFTDERVSMIGTVSDQEEWEKIEQHDMGIDYQEKLDAMDESKRKRYFWVFVRHPKWRVSELPWEQWTLVCEVALEAGDQRLDKWNLMGRLGTKARSLITQCAAWMRPDIIYVKRPVFQCRFEPQEEFFAALALMLDPETEEDYMCELENDDGSMELCTYFSGLCKIVKVSPKAFVDDIVKGYEKLSDEEKSKCLEFLLNNHPVMLLHPFTKEWKANLEEMELGCDAPDDENDYSGDREILDWVEDDGNGEDEYDTFFPNDSDVKDEELGIQEEEEDASNPEHDPKYWDEEFKKAMRSMEGMEKLIERSADAADKHNEKLLESLQQKKVAAAAQANEEELEMRGKRAKISREEWKLLGLGPFRRKIRKSQIPPGLFLRAAVRPFTYRKLVKEIVLTRHAIVEGDIRPRKS